MITIYFLVWQIDFSRFQDLHFLYLLSQIFPSSLFQFQDLHFFKLRIKISWTVIISFQFYLTNSISWYYSQGLLYLMQLYLQRFNRKPHQHNIICYSEYLCLFATKQSTYYNVNYNKLSLRDAVIIISSWPTLKSTWSRIYLARFSCLS